jgi:hypothetical protein
VRHRAKSDKIVSVGFLSQQWKFKIVRRLYEQGYTRQDVINLFHFIDWLLVLPEALATSFWQDLQEYEEEARMPYVTRHDLSAV